MQCYCNSVYFLFHMSLLQQDKLLWKWRRWSKLTPTKWRIKTDEVLESPCLESGVDLSKKPSGPTTEQASPQRQNAHHPSVRNTTRDCHLNMIVLDSTGGCRPMCRTLEASSTRARGKLNYCRRSFDRQYARFKRIVATQCFIGFKGSVKWLAHLSNCRHRINSGNTCRGLCTHYSSTNIGI